MGKVLKRHDYQVLYADTGKQGLEMIRSRCPDLILLDLGLPDMDGCSIIRGRPYMGKYSDHRYFRPHCRTGKGCGS